MCACPGYVCAMRRGKITPLYRPDQTKPRLVEEEIYERKTVLSAGCGGSCAKHGGRDQRGVEEVVGKEGGGSVEGQAEEGGSQGS